MSFTPSFTLFDYCLFAAYLLMLVLLSLKARKGGRASESEYLLAGRRLTLPAFVATLVATWYGGILGVGEYSFKHGISNWLVFGVPYYLAAIIFALFITKPARKSRLVSIPDQLQKAYGRSPAIGGAMMVFVMTVPAAYVLMLGDLLKMYFGGEIFLWIVVGTILSTFFVAWGGLRTVTRVDIFQFVLMYVGFALLIGFAYYTYGGLDFLTASVPATHFQWDGGLGAQAVLVWYFLAMATLIEPSFYQRVYAATTPKVARNGILISIGFWIIFDFMTTFSGLYARAVLGPDISARLSYPLLANQLLPPGVYGLFFLGMVSVIMSTVDGYALLAASTLSRDIIGRWRGEMHEWRHSKFVIALALSNVLAITIAVWQQSVIGIWHDLGSIGLSVLLLPMVGSFRTSPVWLPKSIVPAMIVSGSIALFWTLSADKTTGFLLGIQPVYIGLGSSLVVLGGMKLLWSLRAR